MLLTFFNNYLHLIYQWFAKIGNFISIPKLIPKLKLLKFIRRRMNFSLWVFLLVGTMFTVVALIPSHYRIVLPKTAETNLSLALLSQGQQRKDVPSASFVQNNSLLDISAPSIVSSYVLGTEAGDNFSQRQEIQEYQVQKGDTIASIAQKFNISVNTILWANKLSNRSIIHPGQKLIILPVSGVMHLVKKGETVSEIAHYYRAKEQDILSFNNLANDGKIFIGEILVIPGGKMPARAYYFYREPTQHYNTSIPLPKSYFICPIAPPCHLTQGLHWYNAVDLSHGRCGEPIYAAAGGVIQIVGYTRIYGNYVQILHPNGVATRYAHLSKAIVKPGQKVFQGQIIGYMGHTGHTIPAGPRGCHLHWEVRGAKNPLAKYY